MRKIIVGVVLLIVGAVILGLNLSQAVKPAGITVTLGNATHPYTIHPGYTTINPSLLGYSGRTMMFAIIVNTLINGEHYLCIYFPYQIYVKSVTKFVIDGVEYLPNGIPAGEYVYSPWMCVKVSEGVHYISFTNIFTYIQGYWVRNDLHGYVKIERPDQEYDPVIPIPLGRGIFAPVDLNVEYELYSVVIEGERWYVCEHDVVVMSQAVVGEPTPMYIYLAGPARDTTVYYMVTHSSPETRTGVIGRVEGYRFNGTGGQIYSIGSITVTENDVPSVAVLTPSPSTILMIVPAYSEAEITDLQVTAPRTIYTLFTNTYIPLTIVTKLTRPATVKHYIHYDDQWIRIDGANITLKLPVSEPLYHRYDIHVYVGFSPRWSYLTELYRYVLEDGVRIEFKPITPTLTDVYTVVRELITYVGGIYCLYSYVTVNVINIGTPVSLCMIGAGITLLVIGLMEIRGKRIRI